MFQNRGLVVTFGQWALPREVFYRVQRLQGGRRLEARESEKEIDLPLSLRPTSAVVLPTVIGPLLSIDRKLRIRNSVNSTVASPCGCHSKAHLRVHLERYQLVPGVTIVQLQHG